jgi:hypothetical protein
MKKLLSFVAAATLSFSSFGQAPEGFKYQAVVRDAGNIILNNQAVGLRMTIQQGSIGGTTVYAETFAPTTNAYGLVNLEIGNGTAVSGTFTDIDWSAGPFYIETAVDVTGGTNYSVMGTSQLMSVPYALYAKTSGNGQGPLGPQGPAGEDGTNGLDGAAGPQGVQGIQGIAGINGAVGATGPQGIQGIDGPQGPAGNNGMNGANGLDGNGIASTTDNGDGTFTLTFDNGSTFSTSDLTGPQGATGAQGAQGSAGANGTNGFNGLDGNGIASTTDNGDGTFTLTYDDGSSFVTSDLTGPQGATGAQGAQGSAGANGTNGFNGLDGNGIASTTDNGDGTFTLTFDDGSTFVTSDLTGPQGAAGAQGAQGIQGVAGINGPVGATGPQGIQGIDGPQGPEGNNGMNGANGLDGNGIASTTDNGDGTFTLTYDDGSSFTTSDLTGPQGATGAQGAQGIQGIAGINGAVGATGPQGIQGIDGPQGQAGNNGMNGANGLDGNGIASTSDNGDGTFTLTYDDGSSYTTSDLTGPQGATGAQGAQGIQGIQGVAGINGAVGATGPQGIQGIDGPQGQAGNNGMNGANGFDGNGIASTSDNGDGTFTLTYDDGSSFTTSDLTGPQGATGSLPSGAIAGNTPYWNGSAWVVNNSNIHNNGAGVGIGTTSPNASAKVEIASTTQGFLPPRLTTAERDAIASPAVGLVIYNTTTNCLNFYVGSGWNETCGIASSPSLESQYPAGSVFCAFGPTAIVDVTNPTTGKIWMDRNLGATQVATSSTDANSYGDLYQWGRRSDGHQCRTSPTTTTLSSVNQPANGNFILAPNTPGDWRSPQNTNLWQGVNGVNNPCPSGYRLPSVLEFDAELLSWSANTSSGAFASPLRLPMAGYRSLSDGSLDLVGTDGFYWSGTVNLTNSLLLYFDSSFGDSYYTAGRAYGLSVRCLKD